MALAETSHFILKQKRDGSSITGQQSIFNFHLGLYIYFSYQILEIKPNQVNQAFDERLGTDH